MFFVNLTAHERGLSTAGNRAAGCNGPGWLPLCTWAKLVVAGALSRPPASIAAAATAPACDDCGVCKLLEAGGEKTPGVTADIGVLASIPDTRLPACKKLLEGAGEKTPGVTADTSLELVP